LAGVPRTGRSDAARLPKVFDYLRPLSEDSFVNITSAYVIEVRDAAFAAHRRRFANYVLSVLRLLLKWGPFAIWSRSMPPLACLSCAARAVRHAPTEHGRTTNLRRCSRRQLAG